MKKQTTLHDVRAVAGKLGGEARARVLTSKRRVEIAKLAAGSRTSFGRRPSCLCGKCKTCYNRAAKQKQRDSRKKKQKR